MRNMTKKGIHQRFVDQLAAELESIAAAAKKSFATATDEEHHAEGKYDTFKLESSYLARGQAKRVQELTHAVESLRLLPLRELGNSSPIQLSALVRLKSDDGGKRTLFIAAAAGGEKIVADREEVMIITSRSPLGQELLGKVAGDTFKMKIGIDTRTFTVVSVE
jgi:transcription elongation GreA/GreB family factor